ncbi:MAG: VPLPA-CTERM sorting domain-containing protein, partial [Pseudomonadales bacterium]|nr:VPLPA-CTERM sorting domain-containing protein [Pseudomonadales bacterium]
VGTDGTTNGQQRDIMNAWLADVQAASGGSASFGVDGTDPVSSDSARNGGFFNNSLISVGSTSALFYSQANPADSTTFADANVVSQIGTAGDAAQSAASLAADGSFSANTGAAVVPVPAAAWLFGSALAGLTVVRRRK